MDGAKVGEHAHAGEHHQVGRHGRPQQDGVAEGTRQGPGAEKGGCLRAWPAGRHRVRQRVEWHPQHRVARGNDNLRLNGDGGQAPADRERSRRARRNDRDRCSKRSRCC